MTATTVLLLVHASAAPAGTAAPAPVPYMPYPPYAPYPPYPPLQPKTAQGVGYVRWAVLLGAVTQAITIPAYLYLTWLVLALAPSQPTDPAGFFGLLAGLFALECAVGIVGLFAVIFFFLGFYYVHDGREEYGPEHAQAVERGVIYFVVAAVMAIVASAGGSFSGSFVGAFSPFSAISAPFGVVRGLFAGLLLMSMVRTFTGPEGRRVGWVGTALLAAAPGVNAALALVVVVLTNPLDPSSITGVIPLLFIATAAAAAIELVAYALFFRMYSNVNRRMRAGEFPPAYRPPMVFVPYYPGPMPYPQESAVPPAAPPAPPENPPPNP